MSFALSSVVCLVALVAPATGAPAQHVVTGTIVIEDANGARRPVQEGTVQFWLGGQGGERVDASIADGRFVLELPHAHGWLDIGPITADGVACWALPSWADATIPTTAELVAHRVKPAFARFVDASTGAELDKGWVYRPADAPDEDDHPVARLSAPFEIPLFSERDWDPYRGWIGLREYAVTPQGYVRQRIWLDPSEGGTRTFEFEEAAALQLWLPIAGISAQQHQVLLLRDGSSESWPCGPIPGVCGTTHTRLLAVRDLPGGSWTVRIATKSSPSVDVYPPMRVHVEKGYAAELRWKPAELRAMAERERVRPICELRGTLRLPLGVDPTSIRLRIEPGPDHAFGQSALAELPGSVLARDPQDTHLVHWYAGSVPEGRWIATIPELGWRHEFATAHSSPIALDAAPVPASVGVSPTPVRTTVRFRVVDGASGEEMSADRLIVRAHGDSTAGVWSASDRTWSVTATKGVARVDVERRGEPREVRTLEIDSRSDAPTLTFWPPLWIEVRAYDGDARIGAPELQQSSKPIVEALGHDGRATCPTVTMLRENSYRDLVSQPGRYRVTLAPNSRYAPTDAVEVEVRLGEPTPVAVFRLTRAKR